VARRQLEVSTMKRLFRSLVQSLRTADAIDAPCRALLATAEPLEQRRLLAADLSGGMFNKFATSPTNGYTPGIVTAAGDGANGASSAGDSDDRLNNAKSKSLNFSQDAEISSALDVDLYKFKADAGDRVTFDLDRPALSTLDSVLRLFNAAGQEIAISDDDASPTEPDSLESYIDFTFVVDGTYYIGVSGAFNDGYNAVTGAGDVAGSQGKYKLIAQDYQDPDSNDALNEPEETLGRTDSDVGTISAPTDVDIYRINVSAGDTIAFDVDLDLTNPLTPVDSFLRLFNDNGVQLAINDDGDDPTEVAEMVGHSYFEYTFLEGGTYFIGISGVGNETYDPMTGDGDTAGAVGNYTLYTTHLNP
jgi:hypothetical protein